MESITLTVVVCLLLTDNPVYFNIPYFTHSYVFLTCLTRENKTLCGITVSIILPRQVEHGVHSCQTRYMYVYFIVLQAMADSYLLVAAFDFGTNFSRYAYSFKHDPMKILISTWNTGSDKVWLKTPTSVLLTASKEFDSFGFEAENKYVNLTENDWHHGWMFFRRFSMNLHKEVRAKHLKTNNNKMLCT